MGRGRCVGTREKSEVTREEGRKGRKVSSSTGCHHPSSGCDKVASVKQDTRTSNTTSLFITTLSRCLIHASRILDDERRAQS